MSWWQDLHPEERYKKVDVSTLVRLKPNITIPKLAAGDSVKVAIKVVEGEKQRSQVFQGVIIRIRHGKNNGCFTVRRVTQGVGVERTFMNNSPLLEKIEVVRHSKVRRSRLFYLRALSAKEARLKERQEASEEAALIVAAAPYAEQTAAEAPMEGVAQPAAEAKAGAPAGTGAPAQAKPGEQAPK